MDWRSMRGGLAQSEIGRALSACVSSKSVSKEAVVLKIMIEGCYWYSVAVIRWAAGEQVQAEEEALAHLREAEWVRLRRERHQNQPLCASSCVQSEALMSHLWASSTSSSWRLAR